MGIESGRRKIINHDLGQGQGNPGEVVVDSYIPCTGR